MLRTPTALDEASLRMIPAAPHRPATPAAPERTLTHPDTGAAGAVVVSRTRALSRPIALALWLASVALAACSGNDPARTTPPLPPLAELGSGPLPSLGVLPSCTEGATEECSLTLGDHGGVLSCYEGTRTCVNGQFGACQNGHAFDVPESERTSVPPAGSNAGLTLRPLASLPNPPAATDCLDNPCNRYCREVHVVPSLGLRADLDPSGSPLPSWPTGNLSEYAPAVSALGQREPCQTAGDCQFDTECRDPSLGSCTHSVCSPGAPLVGGCNRCADAVCAIDDDCCRTPVACSHDPCDVSRGTPLDPTCDTCVAAVCGVHPECCSVTWNAACVGYVATECAPLGQSCGCPDGSSEANGTCFHLGDAPRDWGLSRDACGLFGEGWSLTEIDSADENAVAQDLLRSASLSSAWLGGLATGVDQWTWQSSGEVFFINDASGGALQPGYTYANWAIGEPQLGVAGRGIAIDANGRWSDAPLDVEFDYICKGPQTRLTPARPTFNWGSDCVALALQTCGVECPGGVARGVGACLSRTPTVLDPECTSFDVALGPTCVDTDGKTQIPVCNHGQAPAPAGLRLSQIPASEFGKVTPDLSLAVDCTLSEAIPAGRCVTVTNCPGLAPDQALVVNPNDGSQNPSECRTDDNWSLYEGVACQAPVCEADSASVAQIASGTCSIPVRQPLGLDMPAADVRIRSLAVDRHCAPGEELWGASCYFFSSDIATWDDAERACKDRGTGWHLVALNSPAEDSWVRGQTDPTEDVQIGLNDGAVEGDHVWSNGTCRSFINWDVARLQPDEFPPGSEQCSRMTVASGERWEDKACNDGEHPYVCEGPVQEPVGGCASGTIAGPDGHCYAFDPARVSAADAQSACAARGAGWSTAAIGDAQTNAFVTGLLDCTPAWIDTAPSAYSNWAPGEPLLGGTEAFLDEIGLWHMALDGTPRAVLRQGPNGAVSTLPLTRVASSAACSTTAHDEYYVEGPDYAPVAVDLCPNTCDSAAALPSSRLDVEVPCAPPTPPALETTLQGIYYSAECDGGTNLWDFLYYDAVTPADSRIEFSVRTAPSIADFDPSGADFIPIATAHSVPTDTQRCEVNPPGCPIDIYQALVAPAQQLKVLELMIRLVPGTSGEGPLLRDWQVRYSCPPSQ
jgi:hypothetical protein